MNREELIFWVIVFCLFMAVMALTLWTIFG